MREKTPQDYADELLKMYRENSYELSRDERSPMVVPIISPIPQPAFEDGTGGLQVNVTTFGRLYPVKDALITVFTGDTKDMTVVETGITDESGKTKTFNLKTPPISESQQAQNNTIPYASYNISVQSDGYVDQFAMNIPLFSGVVSVQSIDLLPISAAGQHTSPLIINEENNYDL